MKFVRLIGGTWVNSQAAVLYEIDTGYYLLRVEDVTGVPSRHHRKIQVNQYQLEEYEALWSRGLPSKQDAVITIRAIDFLEIEE